MADIGKIGRNEKLSAGIREAGATMRGLARHVADFRLPPVTPVSHFLSGEAALTAMCNAIRELTDAVPKDHDVIVCAFGLNIENVRYAEPHTFIFEGVNEFGDRAYAIVHFSQLVAHVIHRPKQGPKRVVTGFSQVGKMEK